MDLRFGQVSLLQLRLRSTEPQAIHDELVARMASAPQVFQNTGVSLDLSALPGAADATALAGVVDAIRRAGLFTIGIAEGSSDSARIAGALGLPVLGGFRQLSRPPGQPLPTPTRDIPFTAVAPAPEVVAPPPVEAAVPAATPPASEPALVHEGTVRSGQRVYARHRDLVVLGTVGAGAELMADGCVHVYGSLRGRVLAGVRGDVTARVFCQDFHAELVAINGVFRVFETLPPELAGRPVMAWLEGEELRIERLGA
jgi:septum site-determining protein MinC